jgi:hypothetical protein
LHLIVNCFRVDDPRRRDEIAFVILEGCDS